MSGTIGVVSSAAMVDDMRSKIRARVSAPECVRLRKCAGRMRYLLADQGYYADRPRRSLRDAGAVPVIPGRRNRKRTIRYDKDRYRGRHLIKNAFCRLRDFLRVATHYDELAANFLPGVALAATITFWLRMSLNPNPLRTGGVLDAFLRRGSQVQHDQQRWHDDSHLAESFAGHLEQTRRTDEVGGRDYSPFLSKRPIRSI